MMGALSQHLFPPNLPQKCRGARGRCSISPSSTNFLEIHPGRSQGAGSELWFASSGSTDSARSLTRAISRGGAAPGGLQILIFGLWGCAGSSLPHGIFPRAGLNAEHLLRMGWELHQADRGHPCGERPEPAGDFSPKPSCRTTPECSQDREPHCFNYTSPIFPHLVKPGSYRKSYFQVQGSHEGTILLSAPHANGVSPRPGGLAAHPSAPGAGTASR